MVAVADLIFLKKIYTKKAPVWSVTSGGGRGGEEFAY